MRRIAAVVAVVVVALAVASQLLLPGIAEQRLRDRLKGAATGVHVHVSAFPAGELLFGHSDSVTVGIDRYQSQPARLAALLGAARKTDRLDAHVNELRASLVTPRAGGPSPRPGSAGGAPTVPLIPADPHRVRPAVLRGRRDDAGRPRRRPRSPARGQ